MLSSAYNPETRNKKLIATIISKQHFFTIINFIYFVLLILLYGTLCMVDKPKTSSCVWHLNEMNKIKTQTLTTDVYGNQMDLIKLNNDTTLISK